VDLYEVGVYLAIIVVASACVFGIMWLLMRSMQPKRPRRTMRPAPALAAGVAPKLLPQGSPENADNQDKAGGKKQSKGKKEKKEKKKKQPKGGEEKLLKLKELPDSRLLAKAEAPSPASDAAKKAEKSEAEKPADRAEARSEAEPGDRKEAKNETAQAVATAEGATEGQENADIAMPDLPSLDTLTDEEEAPKEDPLDLMSVFDTEDAEDSATSDLAANLFDVDLKNIEKLGTEVSEFLGGMRQK